MLSPLPRPNCRHPRAYNDLSRSASEPKEGWPHDRSRSRMNDHSKLIGYLTLSILVAAFVAWAKYALISNSVFWTILIGIVAFFIAFRVYAGVWPGNNARG